jgi:hypothetical protein
MTRLDENNNINLFVILDLAGVVTMFLKGQIRCLTSPHPYPVDIKLSSVFLFIGASLSPFLTDQPFIFLRANIKMERI